MVTPPATDISGQFDLAQETAILFVLLIVEESAIPHREEILSIVVATVALSALLHGVSAAPLAARFGRLTERMGECEENRPACELPLREGPVQIQSIAQRSEN
jgi:hypothetical protein